MTHLAIGLAVALQFFPHVNNKLFFIPLILFFSLLPDIDSGFSSIGKKWYAKAAQAISPHRGFFHSYTFTILFAVILAFFLPVLALPFFLGYSFHLFADSFTPFGIRPFWPLKVKSVGKVNTGGKVEIAIFWVFVIIDMFLLISLFI